VREPTILARVDRVAENPDLRFADEFGGFSGLEIDPASDMLVAITDRGFAARLAKAFPPRVLAIGRLGLRSPNPYYIDAEGLRAGPDGRWWIAFERFNRLEPHPPGWDGVLAMPLRRYSPPAIRNLPTNEGLESIAVLADGRLVVIAEQAEGAPMLLLDAEAQVLHRYVYESPRAPTDAAALKDGGLLVLTRSLLWPLPPFFSTVLEYVPPGWEELSSVKGRPILALSRELPAENYEGMAVEPSADSTLRIWLISDDNFLPIQRTLLLRLDVPLTCLDASESCPVERR